MKTGILVIGSGPAGYGAACELRDRGIPFMWISDDPNQIGGKVNICPRIDNYPGLKHITGKDLTLHMLERVGFAPLHINAYLSTLTSNSIMCQWLNGSSITIEFDKCVLATGSTPINPFGNNKLVSVSCPDIGSGPHASNCIVVGGGNAALKCTLEMLDRGCSVTLIHRRNEFRGSQALVRRIMMDPKVRILTPYIIEKVNDGLHVSPGEDNVPNHEILFVHIKDVVDGSQLSIDCDYMIVCYGQKANSPSGQYIGNGIELPENVYAIGDVLETKVKGIYISEVEGRNIVKTLLGNKH